MTSLVSVLIDAAIVVTLFIGFAQFRAPRGARRGNYTAAAAVAFAVAIVLVRSGVAYPVVVVAALAAGALAGWIVAMKVTMIGIPAMVAFQHGAGGVAAFMISFLELWRGSAAGISSVAKASGLLGLIIGAATFSGSLIASGKLVGFMNSKPTVLRGHGYIMSGLSAVIAVAAFAAGGAGPELIVPLATGLILMSVCLGVLLAIRIGGADMPVLISFLNATAGVAAAFCGVIVGNRLLIACGATVAASGSILTHVMCKGMNRSVLNVFWSGGKAIAAGTAKAARPAEAAPKRSASPLDAAAEACRTAKRVVIVPGYGMAVGQAQFKVTELAKLLEGMGKEVRFAIHPVAGRMPGHMNVLLAEADVPYDSLFEMDAINPDFPETDVAIVVGASDVVNPAAIDEPGTPIAGMPILKVYEAKSVIVCNLDERPGYSGVPNSLYGRQNAILLFGDAKETMGQLIGRVSQ
ncbi:MAG TPA: NAD(P)(+) transhydrogenase (Re/Si-specific) subunit beta [bacterium]|nr:NAD(P)(+) transhydrogenase (Re/Si-specific) subunit beta [bacterium]